MPIAAIDSFTPFRTEPNDFDAFWSATRDALLEVDPHPVLARQMSPAGELTYDQLSFTSLGQVGISGYLLAHNTSEPRPLVIHSHGYNSQYDVMLNWANRGCHVLGIDFRGFGRSQRLTLASGSYVLTGIDSPHTSILRGNVADLVQAMRIGRMLLGDRAASMTLYGFSFGGAMALMAATLDTSADLVVAGQPTLGWHSERLRLSHAGTGAELRRFLERSPRKRSDVMDTLNYFDTLHFAARAKSATLIGIGLDDVVVPSRSVIAVSNHVAASRFEARILPVAHSDDPRESLWKEFDDEWLTFTMDGLPEDFGDAERQVQTIGADCLRA